MKNLNWINYLKGLAMVLVVAGHTMVVGIRQSNSLIDGIYDYIYMFHMPLFFLLSGFLYQRKVNVYLTNKSDFIKNKAVSLLLPYFSYSLLTYGGVYIAYKIPGVGGILEKCGFNIGSVTQVFKQILFWQNSIDQHVWFIYSLFFVFLISCLFFGKSRKGIICSFAFALVLHILTLKCSWMLLQRVFNYMVFFVAGRMVYSENILEKINRRKYYVYTSAIILSVIKLTIIDILFESYILTSLKAVFSIVVSVAMCLALCLIFMNNGERFKCFKRIYKYNFEIYILHQPFIVSGVVMILYSMAGCNAYLCIIAGTVIGIVIPAVFAYLVRNIKLIQLVLFGKKIKN